MRDVLDQVDIFVTTTGNKDIIMVRHRLCPSCEFTVIVIMELLEVDSSSTLLLCTTMLYMRAAAE